MNLIKHSQKYLINSPKSGTEEVILQTVKKYRDFLAPTYGPAGKKILISRSEFESKAIDDGHMASEAFEMESEFAQAVVQYIRETTKKTNDRVGDGTTTSALIMGSIVEQILTDYSDPFKAKSIHKEVLEIQKAAKEAVEQIKAQAKQVSTQEELYQIAYNSFNNAEIAKLVSETLFKIGANGSITIEDSPTYEHIIELAQGLELAKGFVSKHLITDQERQESVVKNPLIILANERIEFFNDLVPILMKINEAKKKEIVIVAEGFSEEVVNQILFRSLIQKLFVPILIETPGYGDTKTEMLKDIQSVVGGNLTDSKSGKKLSELTLEDLGTCESVISKKDKSVFVGGKGNVQERIKVLNLYLEAATKYETDQIKKRIAALTGGVAVLKIAAPTENEQKSLKAKAEDAINATREAFKSGVVSGAGGTLAGLNTSSAILNKALQEPRRQLEENGKEFLDENVVDPAGVLIAALESAVSIGTGLVETAGIVCKKREDEKE